MWRVVQTGDRPSFALKALAEHGIIREMRGKDLDRNGAVETGVTRFIDLTHAAYTEQ